MSVTIDAVRVAAMPPEGSESPGARGLPRPERPAFASLRRDPWQTMPTVRPNTDASTWWSERHGADQDLLVAYFSMEFGVDARLPIYSGGLGILAGDSPQGGGRARPAARRCRPALPRTATSARSSTPPGARSRRTRAFDPEAFGLASEPVTVEVELAGESLEVAVWRYDVGSPSSCRSTCSTRTLLTDALYGGDREHRIRQELLLGIGGVRALAALGLEPTASTT